MDILDVVEPLREDESIIGYDYRNYYPYNAKQLGKSDEIRIPCHNTAFVHPSESCLYLEGIVDFTAPAEKFDKVRLIKNFSMFLFSEVRFELNGQVVDSVRCPGIVTTVKNYGLLTEQEKIRASEYFWSADGVEISKTSPNFSCCIPLSRIFPLCQDYRKIIMFSKLELVLVRSRSDLDCFAESLAGAEAGLTLTKVAWKIPHVSLADLLKLRMTKILESGREISLGFRAVEYFENPNIAGGTQLTWQIKTSAGPERPLYVIVAFRKDRKQQMSKDASVFDHLALRETKLFLNSHQLPYENMDLDFSKDQFSVLYRMFNQFRKSFYEDGDTYVSTSHFKSQCPLVVFDATKMPPDLKSAPVDVRVECTFNTALPEKTCAHALLIYDKVVVYNPFSGLVLRKV